MGRSTVFRPLSVKPLDGWEEAAHIEHILGKGGQMKRILSAFGLGLLFFFLLFLVGEGLGLELPDSVAILLMFVLSAAYFFICQSFLSRGNPHAFPRDWPVMLALDAVWIISFIIMILVEERGVILGQGLPLLFGCLGGTFAGAAVAAQIASKRKRAQ
jgi:hypothetical protein